MLLDTRIRFALDIQGAVNLCPNSPAVFKVKPKRLLGIGHKKLGIGNWGWKLKYDIQNNKLMNHFSFPIPYPLINHLSKNENSFTVSQPSRNLSRYSKIIDNEYGFEHEKKSESVQKIEFLAALIFAMEENKSLICSSVKAVETNKQYIRVLIILSNIFFLCGIWF